MKDPETPGMIEVWVAERGVYSDRGVVGVYSSLEKAKAAFPDIATWRRHGDSDWAEAGQTTSGQRADHDAAVLLTRCAVDESPGPADS